MMMMMMISASGYYAYIETSAPRLQGDFAQLESDTLSPGQDYCLNFWYHTFGTSIGNITIKIEVLSFSAFRTGLSLHRQTRTLAHTHEYSHTHTHTECEIENKMFQVWRDGVRHPCYTKSLCTCCRKMAGQGHPSLRPTVSAMTFGGKQRLTFQPKPLRSPSSSKEFVGVPTPVTWPLTISLSWSRRVLDLYLTTSENTRFRFTEDVSPSSRTSTLAFLFTWSTNKFDRLGRNLWDQLQEWQWSGKQYPVCFL